MLKNSINFFIDINILLWLECHKNSSKINVKLLPKRCIFTD